MPSLRTLLSDISGGETSVPNRIFYVQNSSDSASNGGCCCLWTAPAGTTKATLKCGEQAPTDKAQDVAKEQEQCQPMDLMQ